MPPNNWKPIVEKINRRAERLEKEWKKGNIIHPNEGDVDLLVRERLKEEQNQAPSENKG